MASAGDRAGTASPAVPAIRLTGITKRFPGVVANDAVDFEAAVGEVHALLGENGAGKSTLSNVMTGLYLQDAGTIEVVGRPVVFRSPRDAIAAGVGMVHQHFRLVSTLTVAENLALGDGSALGRRFLRRPAEAERAVAALGERFGLPIDPRARIWQLSVGEQQRVEILKALHHDARILILDEPTAVLTPQESKQLIETMRRMAADGRTVIFISHRLAEVTAVADRITVLRGGRAVATVDAAGVERSSLAALMVGREIASPQRADDGRNPGEVALAVEHLSAVGDRGIEAVRGVSLEVRAGEVLAVAGVAGNGQRELAEAICGLRPAAGRVVVRGTALRGNDARAAIAAGVAYVPEDRLGTGVAGGLSVGHNAALKSFRRLARGPFLSAARLRTSARELIERYDVRPADARAPVRRLSGGNIQKVVLGRELGSDPAVLVAASPTRGLDVGAVESVHARLRDAVAAGVAILLVSEDLDEIEALADRIAVMYEGRVVGTVDATDIDRATLGLMMAGGEAAA